MQAGLIADRPVPVNALLSTETQFYNWRLQRLGTLEEPLEIASYDFPGGLRWPQQQQQQQ